MLERTVAMSFHTKQNIFPIRTNITFKIWILLTNQNQNFLVFILQKFLNEWLMYIH
jgi:hypothetical protein